MENYGMVKPSKVSTMGTLTLVSGIINILSSVGVFLSAIALAFGTFGVGLLCTPVAILPLVVGILEIVHASKLSANPPKPIKNTQLIPILEICGILYGNILSVVAGILNLVWGNEPEVQEYFQRISM